MTFIRDKINVLFHVYQTAWKRIKQQAKWKDHRTLSLPPSTELLSVASEKAMEPQLGMIISNSKVCSVKRKYAS
jgi:hypothetical protein